MIRDQHADMATRVERKLVRRAPCALLLLLLSSSCGPIATLARTLRPGEQPPAEEAVLIGMAGFRPAFESRRPPGMETYLGFTFSPDAPVSMYDSQSGLDIIAPVPDHQPFMVVVPRRPLYLRTIFKMTSYTIFRGMMTQATWLTCRGRKAVDVQPGDAYVYIGTLFCEHDENRPLGITVEDQFDRIAPHLGVLTGDRPYRTGIPQDLDVDPAAGEVVHVATSIPVPSGVEAGPGTAVASSAEDGAPLPSASPSDHVLSGRVRFRVAGKELTPEAFATAAGHEKVSLELARQSVELGSTGTFRVPVEAGRYRLDHLVLRGPGLKRRAVFIPALEVRTGNVPDECLGSLLLTWDTVHGPRRDGFPVLTRANDCGGTPSAMTSLVRAPDPPSTRAVVFSTRQVRAPERMDDERSLLFVTIRVDMDKTLHVGELRFERVAPGPAKKILAWSPVERLRDSEQWRYGGFFLIPNVPPGVYRLASVWSTYGSFAPADGEELMRVEVTEPGIYDLGAYQIAGVQNPSPAAAAGQPLRERQPDHATRYSLLRSVTSGTRWEADVRRLADMMVMKPGSKGSR